jgi:hypothetical protein
LTDAARAAGLNKNEVVAEPEAAEEPAAEVAEPKRKKSRRRNKNRL